ncbi:MAG: hypothetical protein WB792_16465 [Desulfobacterales bacterium]
MDIIVPEKEDREIIHHRLFSENELGIIKDSTRQELLSIVNTMIDRHSIDALILGCIELPLILTEDEFGITFLNATAIHAQSVVNYSQHKQKIFLNRRRGSFDDQKPQNFFFTRSYILELTSDFISERENCHFRFSVSRIFSFSSSFAALAEIKYHKR